MSKDQSQQPPNANPAARGPNQSIGGYRPPPGPTYGTKPLAMDPGPMKGGADTPLPAESFDPTKGPGMNTPAPATNTNPSWSSFLGGSPGGSANPDSAEILDRRHADYVAAYGNPTWTEHDPGDSPTAPNASLGTNPAARAPAQPTAAQPPGTSPNAVNTANVPPLVGGDDLSEQMRIAQDAAYQNATGYLDPQWQQQQDQLETRLVNQGIPQNSEAWNKAMEDFGRQKEFAYSQARSGAVQQGNAAHGQLFNEGLLSNNSQFSQNLQGAQFSNQVRQQLVNEGFTQAQIDNMEQQNRFNNSMTMRNQDINELLLQQQNPLQVIQALLSGSGAQSPNFTATPGANVGGTDIASIINQATGQANNVYNAQTGAANSGNAGMMATVGTIVAAFI